MDIDKESKQYGDLLQQYVDAYDNDYDMTRTAVLIEIPSKAIQLRCWESPKRYENFKSLFSILCNLEINEKVEIKFFSMT